MQIALRIDVRTVISTGIMKGSGFNEEKCLEHGKQLAIKEIISSW